MAQRLTKNTFSKARNTDVSKALIGPDQYIEAHNVEIVGDGNFFALQNIQGTVNVQNIVSSAKCLGVFRNKYVISGVTKECLTIFGFPSGLFKIWCYDLQGDTLYQLYEEAVGGDYDSSDRVVDAKNYPENGIDILYFTDNYHGQRKIRCVIPNSYTPNFLSEFDISLQRRGGLGSIAYSSHITGALLSGTYQFAYRMVDPATKTLTKWSSLTDPMHVYSSSDTLSSVYAGIGLPTVFGLEINVNPTQDELNEFPYFQLAVVENIFPTTGTATTASLLPLELTANRLSYKYKSNTKVGTIPIDDIVVDLAQIKTVKTLNVKQNRLFGGNVKYVDFTFDNGNPTITSGSILRYGGSERTSYADQSFSSQFIGYFRDEVYRYGIVYSDKYGNKAPVKVLDLTNITENQILSGLLDMKFPTRDFSPSYSLFDGSGNIQGLGLSFIGIKNHPTWATRFEIVRVKRLKNILFQTPLVPMTTVAGIGALDGYPNTVYYNKNAQFTTTDIGNKQVASAIPQTNDNVLVTKNFFWPELRTIRTTPTTTGSGVSVTEVGEAIFQFNGSYQFVAIFPQSTLYGDTAFSFSGVEKVNVVDYALLRCKDSNFNPTRTPIAVVSGDDINTNVSGTFYALSNDTYYYDNTNIKAAPSPQNVSVVAYEFVLNESAGTTITGQSLFKFDNLKTQGLDFGFTPTVCAMGVAKLEYSLSDVFSKSFIAGSLNARADNGYIVGSAGPKYEPVAMLDNKYITAYTFSGTRWTGAVAIANITVGLADDRYGSIDTTHEFISTGASYSFSPSELTAVQASTPVLINLDVWGGDCFVGPQTFKISNSSYSVVNAPKFGGYTQNFQELTSKWNNIFFKNRAQTAISLPVPLENVGQFLELIIESEYNGQVRDIDVLSGVANTSDNIPWMVASDKYSIRSPLTYKYNLNLSKQNSEKVYFPRPQFSFIQTDFQARVVYSDLKIYNTSEQGFDVFKALNYYDLEEKRGGLTKLAVEGDNLYAVQTRGIAYLPTGQVQLQQTDAGSLAVGTSDVIARPIIIDSEHGGQHIRSIIETGKLIFIPDNINKTVYTLSGQTKTDITIQTQNNTAFRDFFLNILPEKNVIGIYDPIKGEYWLIDNLNFRCEIYNENMGFVGNYDFSANSVVSGGVYNNQKLYLIGTGIDTNQLAVHEMGTGPNNYLMGETVVPRVTVVINPEDDVSKVFDNLMLAASDKLSTLDLTVEHETSMGNQTVTGIDLNIDSIEDNFRVKALLDANNSRLRGMRMLATIKWGALTSKLSAIYTKYRLSRKTPF